MSVALLIKVRCAPTVAPASRILLYNFVPNIVTHQTGNPPSANCDYRERWQGSFSSVETGNAWVCSPIYSIRSTSLLYFLENWVCYKNNRVRVNVECSLLRIVLPKTNCSHLLFRKPIVDILNLLYRSLFVFCQFWIISLLKNFTLLNEHCKNLFYFFDSCLRTLLLYFFIRRTSFIVILYTLRFLEKKYGRIYSHTQSFGFFGFNWTWMLMQNGTTQEVKKIVATLNEAQVPPPGVVGMWTIGF